MGDTEKIEALVLGCIRRGFTKSGRIESEAGLPMRVVDRALQRLRKKGAIRYASPVQGWSVVEKGAGT